MLICCSRNIFTTVEYFFSGFFDEKKDPKISVYLKKKKKTAFVTLYTIPFKSLESVFFFGGGAKSAERGSQDGVDGTGAHQGGADGPGAHQGRADGTGAHQGGADVLHGRAEDHRTRTEDPHGGAEDHQTGAEDHHGGVDRTEDQHREAD